MNSYSKIIKARDVRLKDIEAAVPVNFARGLHDDRQYDGSPKKAGGVRRGSAGDAEKKSVNSQELLEEAKRRDAHEAEKRTYERLEKEMEQEKKKLSASLKSLEALITGLHSAKEKLLEGSEADILDLIFRVAEKVIHREVKTEREIILAVLRDAMKNLRGKDNIRIRMNPEDYHYIAESTPDSFGSYGDVLIEQDEDVSPGGAVIETNSEGVDARLGVQLNRVRDSFCNEHGF